MNENENIERLKERVAAAGVPVTGKTVNKHLRAAREQAEREASERFPTAINAEIAARIRKALGGLAVIFVRVFMVFGSFALVVLFPVTEYAAVREGMIAFTDNSLLATLSAATIVIGLIVMYFIRRILADNLEDRPTLYLSLARTARRAAYFVGFSRTPVNLDRAGELYVAITSGVVFLQWSIVLLGFIGRAREHLQDESASNVVAFIGNVLSSEPLVFFGYVGTVVLTFALLQVTDAVVLYIHGVFVDTAGRIGIGDNDEASIVNFTEARYAQLVEEALLDIAVTAEAQNARRAERKQETETTDSNEASKN